MHIKSIHTTIKLGIRYTNKEKRKIFKKIEPSLETLLSWWQGSQRLGFVHSLESESHKAQRSKQRIGPLKTDPSILQIFGSTSDLARHFYPAGGRIDFTRWKFKLESASSNLQALSCEWFSVGLTGITSKSTMHLEIRNSDLCSNQLISVFARLFCRFEIKNSQCKIHPAAFRMSHMIARFFLEKESFLL